MPRIRLDLSYDGSRYCGWQLQPGDPTIQGALEQAVNAVTGEDIRVHGSGRTDSGVHAQCQTAHFDTQSRIPAQKFKFALNSNLPGGIDIIRSFQVPPEFHARYSALRRVYHYKIIAGYPRLPFYDQRCWYIRRNLDVQLLNKLALPLVGTHDFTTFTAAGDASDSKVRNLECASFFPAGNVLTFQISGNAFLWRMVRSIVGTLIETESRRGTPEHIKSILSAADRTLAGATAPPQGLYLYKVYYEQKYGG